MTAQVRLERSLHPRQPVHLVSAQELISRVASLDEPDPGLRRDAVRRLLTGGHDADGPVIVASDRVVLFHRPGMYELDDLRRSEPAIDRLALEAGDPGVQVSGSPGVVVLPDDQGSTGTAAGRVMTPTVERTDSVPQGIFDPWLLTERLSEAARDRAAVEEALHGTPRVASLSSTVQAAPWRVVITCPQPVGTPPRTHDLVFTGDEAEEAATVSGTPVGTWDAALEHAAAVDLGPAAALARTERRLATVLLASAAGLGVLVLTGWLSGALGTAARETPGWLAFAFAVALGALAFGLIAYWAPKDPAGNVNDVFLVANFYSSRQQLLHVAAAVTLGGVALATLLGVVPPVLAIETGVPAPSVQLLSEDGEPLRAVARVGLDDLPAGTPVTLRIAAFDSADSAARPLATMRATADSEGSVELVGSPMVDASDAYLSAEVIVAGEPFGTCAPGVASATSGCTIVALPGDGSPTGSPEPASSPAVPVVVAPITVAPDTVAPVSPSPSPFG